MSLLKKTPATPVLKHVPPTPLILETEEGAKEPVGARLRRTESPSRVWPLLIVLLVVGLIILVVVSMALGGLLTNLRLGASPTVVQAPLTTLNVERTAPYASLNFTVLAAQYAISFSDDNIHPGPAVVRVNLRVTNKTTMQVPIVYYDVLRLLAPNQGPIAPSNILPSGLRPGADTPTCNTVPVSAGPGPGKSEVDCVDFPVPRGIQLKTLLLQLGSLPVGEFLVTIPFSSPYNPNAYTARTSQQSLVIYYDYYGHQLNYHLNSVAVQFDYEGHECQAGQQFYILNFTVDNPNGVYVSPGFGFDYVRLVLNSDRPPVDSTLPLGFNAGATGVAGHVVFLAPPSLKTLTIGFLSQNGTGQQNNTITL